jgi:SAM-dependent methyltransferase
VTPPPSGPVAFRCNVCGAPNELQRDAFDREGGHCSACGSTVRARAIVHVLSTELFGRSLALPLFPRRRDLVGVGLSDWDGYAVPLAERVDYTNTFYHQPPRLDITAIDPRLHGRFHFVIASDVFEHVPPPVSTAFANLRALLRPGGVAVFTVPYGKQEETNEHFPELHEYQLVETSGTYELRNRTRTGELQTFRDLVFHGGPGATLEMRIFAERSLLRDLREAGFAEIEIYDDEIPAWGIVWREDWSFPLAARA